MATGLLLLIRVRAEEDAVKGVINDSLASKQSWQGLEHDLPAIMPSTVCPGPPPSLWRLRLAGPLPLGPQQLQEPAVCRQAPAGL